MELRKVTLAGVNNPKDKITCGILINTSRGEEWANGWASARTKNLNKGETILVHLYEEEYQGKNYLKFTLPSLDHLFAELINVGDLPEPEIQGFVPTPTIEPGSAEEIQVSDIPF